MTKFTSGERRATILLVIIITVITAIMAIHRNGHISSTAYAPQAVTQLSDTLISDKQSDTVKTKRHRKDKKKTAHKRIPASYGRQRDYLDEPVSPQE